MTIQEAILSGKPFKRAGWGGFLTPNANNTFSADDVLALDWERSEPTVTVSKAQLAAQWDAAMAVAAPVQMVTDAKGVQTSVAADPQAQPLTSDQDPKFASLAKALGL